VLKNGTGYIAKNKTPAAFDIAGVLFLAMAAKWRYPNSKR